MKTRQSRNKATLRRGYTTGACAAAAAKAAVLSLSTQMPIAAIEISLPTGQPALFKISQCIFDVNCSSCGVIKDAGDDPDITDGIEIRATAAWTAEPGLSIAGGEGIGRVTKPGLDIPVGDHAINPVPRRMIIESVREAMVSIPPGKGLLITLSAPRGAELARRTLNSRLGIVGGISIIGTSGVVIPYSTKAYTACISRSLDVAEACGCDTIVLSTGRRSEKYAQREIKLPEESFILAGDYIGYSLKNIARKGFRKAIIWGMIGKMSKLAAGSLYTNVSDSSVDIGLMTELAGDCGMPAGVIDLLSKSVTANHFRRLMPPEYVGIFCNRLSTAAAEKCREAVFGQIVVQCITTDPEGRILGKSDEQK